MKTNTKFGLHSTRNKIFRFCMGISSVYILMLSFFTLFPYYEDIERAKAEGAPNAVQSTINLDVTSSTAELNFSWTGGTSGTFASSGDAIVFDASTNNSSGYTLRYVGSNDTGTLTHEDGEFSFSSISSPLTLNDFSATANNTYNNQWGFKPSKYVSGNSVINNTGTAGVFLPVPTTTGVIIDKTNAPNVNEENYTIEIGARADMNIVAGEYAGSYDILITANPVSYRITYAAGNTTDEVQNLPETQNSSTSDTSIILSSETPARAHHSFLGWCDVLPTTTNGTDSCTGTNEVTGSPATQYAVGSDFGINQTTQNNTTLYAMWQIDTFTCTKQYRLENADGTWGEYIFDGTEIINYGTPSCEYSREAPAGYYRRMADMLEIISLEGITEDVTKSIDFYRIMYEVSRNDVYDYDFYVIGGNFPPQYRWGETVTLSEIQHTNTTCRGYNLPVWTTDDVDLENNVGNEISFIMPMHSVDITMTVTTYDIPQEVTLSKTGGASGITIDGTTYTGSTASLTCDTHTISGVYTNDYEFDSWSATNGVAVTEITADPTTMTVSGAGTLTLNGKQSCISTISGTMQEFSDSAAYCSNASGVLTDSRGGSSKSYTVAKIDGLWWMTRNLDLPGGTTLTPSDSNVASNYTLPVSRTSTDGGVTLDGGFTKNAVADVYNSSSTTCASGSPCYSYYNYVAATAGTNPSSGNATSDICPKGWRLPTRAEFTTLKNTYTTGAAITVAPWYGVYAGGYGYGSSFFNGGSDGNYWSSTANTASLATSLLLFSGSANVGSTNVSSGTKNFGYSIRCVLDNTSISDITTMQQFGSLSRSARNNVIDSMTEGQAYTLTDTRDNESYSIAKLADGKVWLLDNLRLDLTNSTVQTKLTSSTTNASDASLNYLKNGGGTTSDQYATASVSADWNSSYSAPLVNTAYKDTTGTGGYAAGKYGVYYNYCAVSAGSYCFGDGTSYGTSSGNATEDICPKGWRMPTGGASGEYQALYTAYNSDNTSFVNALRAPLSGYFDNGSAGYQGSGSYFWSSTHYVSSSMGILGVSTSNVNPQISRNRYRGFSVRCVLQ